MDLFLTLLLHELHKYHTFDINPTNQIGNYSVDLANGHWARTSTKYYVDWKIKISDSFGNQVDEISTSLENRRVYIALESSALGDTLAWFPYIDEFRKKHKCTLICSTFWNFLFEKNYPEIEFITPGSAIDDLYALYRVGWFYNSDNSPNLFLNPFDFKLAPLQKTSSDILGLDYKEIKPVIAYPKKERLKKV